MLIQDQISTTIVNAQFFSRDLLNKIILQQNYGEDVIKQQNQFIILGEWIRILQNYLDNNFDVNGNIIPIETCLTIDQIQDLMSKVNIMIGNNRYTLPRWILAYAFWNDGGVWDDTAQFNDYVPLI